MTLGSLATVGRKAFLKFLKRWPNPFRGLMIDLMAERAFDCVTVSPRVACLALHVVEVSGLCKTFVIFCVRLLADRTVEIQLL